MCSVLLTSTRTSLFRLNAGGFFLTDLESYKVLQPTECGEMQMINAMTERRFAYAAILIHTHYKTM